MTIVFKAQDTGTLPVLLFDWNQNELDYTVNITETDEIKFYHELDYDNPIIVDGAEVESSFADLFMFEWANNVLSGAAHSFYAEEGKTYFITFTIEGSAYYETQAFIFKETLEGEFYSDRLREYWTCGGSGDCSRTIVFVSEVTGNLNLLLADWRANELNYTVNIKVGKSYTELAYSEALPLTGAEVDGSLNADDNSFADWNDDPMVGKDFKFTAVAGKMYEFTCTMEADNYFNGAVYVLTGGTLEGSWNDILSYKYSYDDYFLAFTLNFIPAESGEYRLLLTGSYINEFDYAISVTENTAPKSYAEIDYPVIPFDASTSGTLSETADVLTNPESKYSTGKGYQFAVQEGKTYEIFYRFTSNRWHDSYVGFFLLQGGTLTGEDSDIIMNMSYWWYDSELSGTSLFTAEYSGNVRILLFDESLRDIGYTIEINEINILNIYELLGNTTKTIDYSEQMQFTGRGFTDDMVLGDGIAFMWDGGLFHATSYKIALEAGDRI